jgi:hypothetical protein
MALSRTLLSFGSILLFGLVGCQTPVTVPQSDLPVKDYSVNLDGVATITRIVEVGSVPYFDFTWEATKFHGEKAINFKQVGRTEIADLPAGLNIQVGTKLPIEITRDYHQVGSARPQELPVHAWRYIPPASH